MNCIIYLRVSTREQAESGYSIPAQREACVKYIQDKGWNLVDEYVDRGESARTADRPQLQEMLHRLKEDQAINAVLVHKLDRLARNIEDHAGIRAILRKAKAQLISVTENLEDSASGKLVEGILAAIAEFYSANLGMESKKGMLQKVKQGGWPHRAPVGYKNMRDKDGIAKVIPDEEQEILVKECFSLYATGDYSASELHQIVLKKGLRNRWTRKPLARSKIVEMLHNKFYIGKVVWQGVEYQGHHKPLISKELFDRVQEVFRLHDKAGERKRKHPHYLKGTVFCGGCKSKLSLQLAKGQYPYFYCLGRHQKNGCKQSYIPLPIAEKQIIELYKDIELPKNFVQKLTDKLQKELLERESFNVKKRQFLSRNIERLSSEREKLLQAYYAEAIPLELLKKEQDRISTEIANLEAQLQTVSAKFDLFEEIIRKAVDMASNCAEAYKKASPKVRRMFNQAFFKKIYVKNKKVSGAKYTEPFDLLFNFDKSSNKDCLVASTGFEPVLLG